MRGQAVAAALQAAEKSKRRPDRLVGQIAFPAGHVVGDALFLKALLQQRCLPVRAVQHRDISKAARRGLLPHGRAALPVGVEHVDAAHHPVDLLGDKQSLGKRGFGREQPAA